MASSGVPYGSVLGPVLLICLIHDMPDAISSFIHVCADDAKIFGQITDNVDNGTLAHMNQIGRWTEQWKLRFYIDKCKVMHLGKETSPYVGQSTRRHFSCTFCRLFQGKTQQILPVKQIYCMNGIGVQATCLRRLYMMMMMIIG
jgi:Reverse transcriptase (RNA-dependent DNA polymerase)